MNAKRNAALSLVLMLSLVSCATRPPTVPNPTVPQTALRRTILWNDAVSHAVLAVQHAAGEAQKQGLITAAQAQPYWTATNQVAIIGKSILAITSKGTEASWNIDGPAIRKLLEQAHITIPPAVNPYLDLVLSTLNAALTLLRNEVN